MTVDVSVYGERELIDYNLPQFATNSSGSYFNLERSIKFCLCNELHQQNYAHMWKSSDEFTLSPTKNCHI